LRFVAAGSLIVAEGEPGHEAFVIKSGTCAVRSEGQGHIRDLEAGEVFGELAILTLDGRRTSTVAAVTDVQLLVVTRERLSDELGLNSWMGVFVRAVAERFADLEGRMAKPAEGT
jgi:CRP-like cAMP-binding protein